MTTEFMKSSTGNNWTHSVIKSGSYTLTTTDEHVKLSATATLTLPQLSTLSTLGKANKVYFMEIGAASIVGTFSCNAADTINGSGTTLAEGTQNAFLVLESDPANKNWIIVNKAPYLATANYQDGSVTTVKLADDAVTNAKIGALAVDTAELAADAVDGTKIEDDAVDTEHIAALAVETAAIAALNVTGAKLSVGTHFNVAAALTTGTTPIDLFSAAGAPAAITIKAIIAVAQDTLAGNMILTNGTLAVATFAKSTTAGIVTGEDGALANTAVTSADTCTVESSTTNGNGMVVVVFTSA